MREALPEAILTASTVLVALVILLPLFFALQLLIDLRLEFALAAVVVTAVLLGYVLHRETRW